MGRPKPTRPETPEARTDPLSVAFGRLVGKGPPIATAFSPLLWDGLATLALISTAAWMAHWTWCTWPDILVDFGRELYVPWQLTEGRRLYADIEFFSGPLSQYLNAFVFRMFGTGFLVLVTFNLLLLTGLLLLLYYALRQIAGRGAAFGAGMVFVLLFAFGQFVPNGNYNYVCPYSHEITHGLLLSLAALVCLWQVRRLGLPAVALGGFALGLVTLTKIEIFFAASTACLAAVGLTLLTLRPGPARGISVVATFVGSFLLPPLLAVGLLYRVMPLAQAWAGVLAPFHTGASIGATSLAFYRTGMGSDDVAGSLAVLLRWTGYYAMWIVPSVFVSLACRRLGGHRNLIAAGTFLTAGSIMSLLWRGIGWGDTARPWPLFLVVAAILLLVRFIQFRRDPFRADALIRRISFVILALVLLSKMALNTHIYHYGFALAMPAALVLVVILWDWIPDLISRFGGARRVFRASMLVLLTVTVMAYLYGQNQFLQRRTVRVADDGHGVIRADGYGVYVNAVLDQLRRTLKPGETLAVLPEGVMLNYLCRTPNPTAYINFMPLEMTLFGEGRILSDFQARPPDFVVLVHKDTSEYGYQFFGRDYGQELFGWLTRNYSPVGGFGAPPLQDDRFGILLLQKQEPGSVLPR